MEIAAVLRQKNESRSWKGVDGVSGISNFPFWEKNVDLFISSNVSAFYIKKVNDDYLDYVFLYEPNFKNNNIEYWRNPFTRTEIKDVILTTDEYKGFEPIEIAEITVEYKKDTFLFSKVFRLVFLQKSAYNSFYPEPYLIICPELELEGMGRTKEDALSDIHQLFDIYFNETKKISSSPHDHLEIIETKINKTSIWKDDFYQLYKDLHKKDNIIISNLKYSISIEEQHD